VPILFGIGIGTATYDAAKLKGRDPQDESSKPNHPIGTVQRTQLTDYSLLGFGARCIEVVGEP